MKNTAPEMVLNQTSVRGSLSQPQCAAQAVAAEGVIARRPESNPIRKAKRSGVIAPLREGIRRAWLPLSLPETGRA